MKPPEAEVQAIAAGWLAKAKIDLRVCDSLAAQDADLWEAVTFHCQQAVEKALKAVLVRHQVEFPKTHDLQRLLDLVATADPELVQVSADAVELTPYGVEYRYPGEYPPVDRASALAAMAVARRVYDAAAERVGSA
jgi:HEPN domain-containing protein